MSAPYKILEDRDVLFENPDMLVNTPSRKDGIDEATETALRIYGYDIWLLIPDHDFESRTILQT
jgi:hypothetical protein